MSSIKTKSTIFIIFIIVAWVGMNTKWRANAWERIIAADGRGYYSYLPAIFIYHDLNFNFFNSVECKVLSYKDQYNYLTYNSGAIINKYYCGVAVLESPFFLMGHAASYLFDKPMNGYSKLYFKFIHIGGWIYFAFGLWFLSQFLASYGFKETLICLVLLITVFGTNLFYYSVHESGLSHVFSFFLFSVFIYFTRIFFSKKPKWLVVFIPALLGLIILVRPANGLVLLAIPFIAGSKSVFLNGFRFLLSNYKRLIVGILIAAFIVSIQLIMYKIASGKFFLYSYGNETFVFSKFNLINFLFSYKKGLFLYTPVYLFMLFGFISLWKKSRFQFYTGLSFIILVFYVLSSWWNWWYGGSFSSRVMVEYLPFFAFLLTSALANIKPKSIKIAYISILIIFSYFCQIQTYQYYKGTIHWDSMTKEKYWDVFMKT
ncbi:MAG: hypothetical protein AUJ98_03650 [Bacteroidetes bacterium CG2_30_33_31]|nr:MAG: hypothetical protein AUJ98_03650 [Bacteroidetes bacterium CG2_30_33_31]